MSKPYTLNKLSLPNDWEMEFDTLDECIDELRRHLCLGCLSGSEFESDKPVDVQMDGRTIECRDPRRLLATACGCEYAIEGDLGFWEHAA